jgi:hypothetical protein
MADLNALIAQGAKFDMPSPINQMVQMQALQQGQQQNQMNQMKMQESQRGQQEMNALRGLMSRPGFDLSTPASQRDVYNVAPTLAENLIKGHMGNLKTGAEVRNLGFTGQETQAKLAIEKQKHLGQMYRDISSRPSDANITAHAEDVEASPMYTPEEKTAVRAKAERLLAMPMADRMAMLSQQGATAGELRPQVVGAGGSLMRDGTVVGTAPEKTPTYAPSADQQGYETAQNQGYKGTFLDYKKALALASRTPAAEPAPTITQVVDPKNSKQMLNVNARLYGGGSMGDAGVIGVAGREPGYVAREEKAATKQTETEKSRGQVDNLVTQLGGYYDALSNEGGITSTGLRAGSNAMAGLASSGLGQATGRLFGTQAQSQRNSIVQTRPLLVQAIKNATGMSAKQMDSNVELKMMLATATDPTLDLEANRRALANLAALYGTGGGAAPPPTPSPGAPTRANAAKNGWGQIQVVTP